MTDHTQMPGRQKALTMLGALLGMLLAALDQTIVATAGPTIQRELHIAPSLYVWLTTSYLVSSTVMTPVWGKLSDLFGRRRILLAGISVFLLGSAACGVSQDATQLIVARVVQGLGAASLFTTAFAVIADIFTPRERGKYAGIFGAVFGLSSVVGPLLGGLITDTFGWHWCFFINLPIGLVAVVVIVTRMPPLVRTFDVRPTIDFGGAAFFGVAVVPLLLALSFGKTTLRDGEVGYLWASPQIIGLFVASAVGVAAFIAWERRAKDPLIDLHLFANRAFTIGNVASFATGLAFLGAIVFLPLFMVNVVGLSSTSAGLTTTPLTFGIVFGNIFSGQISSRTGKYKAIILGSQVILMAGFAVMAFTVTPDATQAGMTLRMILVGLGLGPAIPLFNLHISNAVAPHQIGAATSTATLSRSLGSTVGLAIFGTVFGTTLTQAMTTEIDVATKDLPPAMVQQMRALQQPASSTSTSEEAPATTAFDAVAIKARIHERFAAQRATVDAALDGDAAALGALKQEPNLDARLRAVVDAGGFDRAVGAAFDAAAVAVGAAFDDGPDAVSALRTNASLPAPLRARLAAIPAEALASPQTRAEAKAQVLAGLNAARGDAIAKAKADAKSAAAAGLVAVEERAVGAVDAIGAAIKRAFTSAVTQVYFVAIFFALAALLVSLLLPELPLRGGPGAAPPPTE